jgi:hypothetical protein
MADQPSAPARPGANAVDLALRHAVSLLEADDVPAALAALRTLLAFAPGFLPARRLIAEAHLRRGDFAQAEATLATLLKLQPQDVPGRALLARLLFLAERWREAWAAYQVRFEMMNEAPRVWRKREDGTRIAIAPWRGEAPWPRQVMVMAEQGLGDTIHFARFLPQATARGLDVSLVAPLRLHPLLRRLDARFDLLPAESPPADLKAMPWLPLLDLPAVLNLDPADYGMAAPYLSAEPERLEVWRKRLSPAQAQGARLIGVAWRGNPAHTADRTRSMPLAALAPLAKLPGVRLVSLQADDAAAREIAESGFAEAFLPPGGDLDRDGAFIDTAAIMTCLDHVVSVDTSVAHLAGALGRPLSLLLARHVADWRWLARGTSTLWYPSARLYRQHRLGAWDGIVADLAADLARPAVSEPKTAKPARGAKAKPMAAPKVPVSIGELLDKVSILTLKTERVTEAAARELAARELGALQDEAEAALARSTDLPALYAELHALNATLWDIENRMRGHEAEQRFDAAFVDTARSVYRNNDRRAAVKRAINAASGSALVEVKQHRAS